jgi:hypothetical protein
MHTAAPTLLMATLNCPTMCYLKPGEHATSLSLLHSVNGVTYPFTHCIYDGGPSMNMMDSVAAWVDSYHPHWRSTRFTVCGHHIVVTGTDNPE